MAIENILEVEKSLGLESGKLQEMIGSDEVHKIDLSKKVILDESVYNERVSNIKKETIQHTQEVFIKDLRNEFGLEFEGKTKDNLINGFKTKLEKVKDESIKDPEERYTNLKSDFDKLQTNFVNKEKEVETIKNEFSQKEKLQKIKNDVFQFIPENTLVSKNTIMIEAEQKGFMFDTEDGNTVIKDRQGNILKNETTLSPIGIKEWITEFSTPFLPKVDGGNGGGDDKRNPTAGSYDALMKEAKDKGWDNSKLNEEVMRRTKDGTLKM